MEQIFLYNKILSHCTSEFSPIMLGGLKIDPVVFHFAKDKEKIIIASHQHRFAELTWVIDGSMGYIFGKELQVISSKEKNFIFIPSATSHLRISQENNSNIVGFLLDMIPQNKAGELFLDAIRKFAAERNYLFENMDFINEFEGKLLSELNSEKTIFIGRINFYIYEFLFNFFSNYFSEFLIQQRDDHNDYYDHDGFVVDVKQMIEERLPSSISLSFIAKRFNISIRHLNRVFREQTGCSVGNYIILRKLNASKKMLYNPTFSVKQIADSLGFKRDAYFSYFFKKHTGMTPIEYSKQLNKN